MFSQEVMEMLIKGIGETLYMTLGATIFGYVLGLPMGIIMVTTSKDGHELQEQIKAYMVEKGLEIEEVTQYV